MLQQEEFLKPAIVKASRNNEAIRHQTGFKESNWLGPIEQQTTDLVLLARETAQREERIKGKMEGGATNGVEGVEKQGLTPVAEQTNGPRTPHKGSEENEKAISLEAICF